MYIYRPPKKQIKHINEFFEIVDDLSNILNDKTSLIVGDFNFNVLNKNTTNSNYNNIMNGNNHYICDSATPTRNNSCLDHVFVNDISLSINLHYCDYDVFDHTLIFVEFKNVKLNPVMNTSDPVIINKINYDSLRISLTNTPIVLNSDNSSVDQLYDHFNAALKKKLVENSSTKKVRTARHSHKPSISKELHVLTQKTTGSVSTTEIKVT